MTANRPPAQNSRLARVAAVIGIVAGAGSLAVRGALLGEEPGDARYDELNEMWLLALSLVPVAVACLYAVVRDATTTLGRVGAAVAFIGSALAASGNAIEFRLGSDAGFILFGLGLCAFAGGMITFGAGVSPARQSKEASFAIQAVGPLGFLSSIAGPIGLVAGALFIVSWAIIAIRPPLSARSGNIGRRRFRSF